MNSKRTTWLNIFLVLTKARITVAVTLTTATGYVVAAGTADWAMFFPVMGTLLLAAGASALNECQEVAIDSKMRRTRNRPLPSGQVRLSTAIFIAGLLILLGLYFLASSKFAPGLTTALGAFSVFWYNGVYTYLKRISAFAVIPGALIGALPPIIGWTAAGGGTGNPAIVLLASFFFIWQIPHFWLLLVLHGREYAEAGLPTITGLLSDRQLARITYMWILSTATAGLLFPALSRDVALLPWGLIMVLGSFWLAAKGSGILWSVRQRKGTSPFIRAFIYINVYALVVIICLSFGALGLAWV